MGFNLNFSGVFVVFVGYLIVSNTNDDGLRNGCPRKSVFFFVWEKARGLQARTD